MPIYLDHAAATPLDTSVLEAMQPFLNDQFYNPSALYQAGRQARQALEAARNQVAQTLGARSSEIIFTAGGTESDNLAIHGVMRRYLEGNVVVSGLEHEAVLVPAQQYNHTFTSVPNNGVLDPEAIMQTITDTTVLVSVMYANNEIGTIQPVAKIARLIAEVRKQRRAQGNSLPLLLHSDACQAANYLDLQVSRLGIDLLTLNGSKTYGPKQTGVLYVKGGIELAPLILGGGQERGLRSGTENVAGFVGLAASLHRAQMLRHEETTRLQQLQQQFITGINQHLPQAICNGSLKQRLPNNVHITLPGYDNERLLIQLDEAGVLAAAGSACSASSDTPSHVLRAIGLSDEAAQSSLRFTMGRSTTADDVTYVLQTLRRLVA